MRVNRSNPAIFGAVCALCVYLAFGRVFTRSAWWLVPGALYLGAAFLSYTRSAWVCALAALLLVLFEQRRRGWTYTAVFAGGVLVASDILISRSARELDVPGFCIEAPIQDGFGPWPDFWSGELDHGALAAAAGLRCVDRRDATANTLPSHRFTAPSGDGRRDPRDVAARAALMLRWLHARGHLQYLYLRFDRESP